MCFSRGLRCPNILSSVRQQEAEKPSKEQTLGLSPLSLVIIVQLQNKFYNTPSHQAYPTIKECLMLVYVKKAVRGEEIAPHTTRWRQTSQQHAESQVTELRSPVPAARVLGASEAENGPLAQDTQVHLDH